MAIDSEWDYVTLLLPMEGPHNSTVILEARNNFDIATAGGPTLSTSDPPFPGGSSLVLSDTDQYISTPGIPYYFSSGTDDFIYEIIFETSEWGRLLDFYTSGEPTWKVTIESDGKLSFVDDTGEVKHGSIVLNDGEWRYLAVSRTSGVLHFHTCTLASGVLVEDGSGTTYTKDLSYVTSDFTVGGGGDFTGRIGPVRITLYSSRTGFTCPTGPFLRPTIKGVTYDDAFDPAERVVIAQNRRYLDVMTSTVSDPVTGAYKLYLLEYDPHVVTCYDATEVPLGPWEENGNARIIDRVLPGG